MSKPDDWRHIVASALNWDQGHASFDAAIDGLPAALRGRRPDGFPHSAWELVEHIRRTQHDLLEFCENPKYKELKWPDDYWPSSPAPAGEAAWNTAVEEFHRDNAALATFASDAPIDLTAKIPHGTGQTYLRTVILAIDHTSYHVGQIIAVRRLLGDWPSS